MIKLVASDMDGTLLDVDGNFHPDTFKMIEKLHQKNIQFVAASGRQYQKLYESFGPVADEIAYICENGAVLILHGELIHECVLDHGNVLDMIRDARKVDNAHLLVCTKDCAYLETDHPAVMKQVKMYHSNIEILENLERVPKEIIKMSMVDLLQAESNGYAKLAPHWKDRLILTVSTPTWTDIYHKETSKGVALKKLQEHYQANYEETMVFGDYFNDVSMLKQAKYSYAMANAPEGVKAEATYEAPSNKEYGVLQVIYDRILG
jgi:hypothetical protein